MPGYDLIIRGGTLITLAGATRADLAIAAGRIAAIGPDLAGRAAEELDARGLHVMPGLIDAHVHFNEPGRTAWEGFASGSRALAAGGGTLCFEMPLNASPPTLDAASFRLKQAAAEAASLADFALWGGLVPGSPDRLDELAACGAIGFKAFMSNSGIADFPAADDLTLYEGMARAARLGRVVAVHAESEALTAALAARAVAEGRLSARDYLASRPVLAELEAIQRALLLAEEAGCALHIVHVSSGRGVALVAAARARGLDVSCETCPHYLVLTEDDVERLGAVAKCAPPIRPAAEQARLWAQLLAGAIDLIASDHSPAPPELKEQGNRGTGEQGRTAGQSSRGTEEQGNRGTGEQGRTAGQPGRGTEEQGNRAGQPGRGTGEQGNRAGQPGRGTGEQEGDRLPPASFFALWGGIAGVQATLPLLLEEGYHRRGLGLAAVAALTATNVARRFGLGGRKGALELGADADLALVALDEVWTLRREEELTRHRLSPYLGRTLRGRIRRTIRRGQTIYADGKAAAGAGGQLVTPEP